MFRGRYSAVSMMEEARKRRARKRRARKRRARKRRARKRRASALGPLRTGRCEVEGEWGMPQGSNAAMRQRWCGEVPAPRSLAAQAVYSWRYSAVPMAEEARKRRARKRRASALGPLSTGRCEVEGEWGMPQGSNATMQQRWCGEVPAPRSLAAQAVYSWLSYVASCQDKPVGSGM